MNKTKIKTDSHGLYFRAGGYVFRPDSETAFKDGQVVSARHVRCTRFGKAKAGKVEETWLSHGSYFDDKAKIIPTDKVFEPLEEKLQARRTRLPLTQIRSCRKYYVVRSHSHTDRQCLWKVLTRELTTSATAWFERAFEEKIEKEKNPKTKHRFFVVEEVSDEELKRRAAQEVMGK